MPTPKVEFELEPKLPLDVRSNALDFTDRWRGFEADVFRGILRLTATKWRLTKIKVRFQSTAAPEPETREARATIQIDANAAWRASDYLGVLIRELIVTNMRERVRHRIERPIQDAVNALLAEVYSNQLLVRLLPGFSRDLRPAVARFLSLPLPAKYPQADKESLLAAASRVRAVLEAILSESPVDSGRFYDAFLQLSDRLDQELAPLLTPNL